MDTHHEYKQILHNMIHALFTKDSFYDTHKETGTSEYYTDAIRHMMTAVKIIDNYPTPALPRYKHLVQMQVQKQNTSSTPSEYCEWLINVMYP